ncbi:FAD-dependent oxidoreductase [Salinimicrobium xinjiangense]|uniref:FAD-dependent oxidoreductase n=1 Tax=Salinimicrobium xinjiangense TaxID=438596 RepID=UPI0003F7C67E|nr:NAD(P)/FAD-dependent oxidoreductase [Salinimicrobium xinjiangense]
MQTDLTYDVLIVGAGPVGLSLGISLAQKGKKVILLEKEASTAEYSRAPSLWPKTQEILAELGVIHHFQKAAIELPVMEIFDADKNLNILRLPIKELGGSTPFPQLLLLPQSKTEEILLKKLKKFHSATVIFSSEVSKVIQEKDKVNVTANQKNAEKQYSAKIVVGADGAHSTVREQMQIAFPGTTYAFKAALADIKFPDDLMIPFPRISTKECPAIGIKISENLWRIIMPFSDRDKMELQERSERSVNHLFPQLEWELVWKSEFSLYRRLASNFTKGRVVLAGDAAHLNSPVGGQGMNSGIQDVPVLTAAIIESLTNNNSGPLEVYSNKRRKEIEKGVNRFTHILTRILLKSKGKMIKPVFKLLNYLMRFPPLRRKFLKKIAMLS